MPSDMKSLVAITAILFFASFSVHVSAVDCPTKELIDGIRGPDGRACMDATGYSIVTLKYPSSNEELARVCANPACQRMIQQLNNVLPPGCTYAGFPFRDTFVAPLMTDCFPPQCGNEQVGPQSCPSGFYCQPWNPYYYQCRRIEATCGRQEVGIDYYGNDLGKFQFLLPEECCRKCIGMIGCKGYTFVNYNPDGKAYCYLKSGTGTRKATKGVVSAVVGRLGTRCPAQQPDVDLFGDDLFNVKGIGIGECCEKCFGTSGCKAWTYAISDQACYLKRGAGTRRPGKGLISVVM